MPRYKLTLEYDGGPFRGWQRQSGGDSVQQALEEAVRKFCGEDVQVVGPDAPMPAFTPPARSRISI